ncbi:hypothetical protein [Streptomyces sp. NPDC088137]|uniref:hypothetical protein n=1 Tax=Streptomyces sp. NPDC088137 TaxID=3365827 RepID=UPI0037FA8CE3
MAFLKALDEVGSWPQNVRKIGVANGVDTGAGNGIEAGATAVKCDGDTLHDTWLKTQAQGDQEVARLQKTDGEPVSVRTSGLPDIDGAPGGLFTVPSPAGDTGSFGPRPVPGQPPAWLCGCPARGVRVSRRAADEARSSRLAR